MSLQIPPVVVKMLSQFTLRMFCIFLSVAQFARLEAAQDTGYGDFLQRIRNGDAPVSSNHTPSDWVYSSQSSAFEVALRKGKINYECSPFQKLSYMCKQTFTQNKGPYQYKSKTQFLKDIVQSNGIFHFYIKMVQNKFLNFLLYIQNIVKKTLL